VPDGGTGRDGAYVGYPFKDLLGEVTLASAEAQCAVVGEDLGTVPEGFRDAMAGADMLGYRVMLLEREGGGFASPAHYPRLSLACVTSHDLPTFAGWWRGLDIDERAGLELVDAAGAASAAERRAAERTSLAAAVGAGPGASEAETARLAHGALGAGGSALVMIQADDLAGEERAVNMPGTDTERPNWRRRLRFATQACFDAGRPILEAVRAARGSSTASPRASSDQQRAP
jgi:glycogen operon protein